MTIKRINTDNPAVNAVGHMAGEYANAILDMFKKGAKIAVVVWNEDHPGQEFLIINDEIEIDAAIKALEALKAVEKAEAQ